MHNYHIHIDRFCEEQALLSGDGKEEKHRVKYSCMYNPSNIVLCPYSRSDIKCVSSRITSEGELELKLAISHLIDKNEVACPYFIPTSDAASDLIKISTSRKK
jgi:hypothetical protein